MIQAKIKSRIEFPRIALQGDLVKVAKNIIIPDIIRGINSRVSIMGGALPKNERATIKRKGHDNPLIDTRKLIKSFFYKSIGKNKVLVSIRGDRKEIAGFLQDGIRTRRGVKKYIFFGISKDAYGDSMNYMRRRVQALIDAERRK